jgi:catechol 2,3-dioxygenase-like lactoylglutathione lyase family enzyme
VLDALDHVALVVRDVAASAAWYADTLGLRRVHEDVWDVPAMMMAPGSPSGVALFAAREGAEPAPPRSIGMAHLAFRADRAAYEGFKGSLAARGIAWEEEDHEIAHSIYFADPDGHRLEITTYDV